MLVKFHAAAYTVNIFLDKMLQARHTGSKPQDKFSFYDLDW